jgi:hypothetical protein
MIYDGTNFQAVGIVPAGAPIYLQANTNFFVGGTGASDSNDGLSATLTGGHGPWATLQHASIVLSRYNLNGFNVTVTVANGTYAPFTLQQVAGAGMVTWVGNPSTPTSCSINGNSTGLSCIKGNNVGNHTFNGFQLFTSGTPVSGDSVSAINILGGASNVTMENISFGACGGSHISVGTGALILLGGNITLTGGCSGNPTQPGCHIFSNNGQIGVLPTSQPAYNVTAAIAFAGATIEAVNLSYVNFTYSSFSNGANISGVRYFVINNSVINTNGGGGSYIPGTVAGTAANGGQYV